MKVLIADDEKLVRFSLKSMLEEIGVPSLAISAVSDGDEMVEAARRSRPDVALVDIKMPKLDGLAAIEKARVHSPATRWIILTSHTSFDFARRAIQLGASEYLLKPVSPGDLERVLGKIAGELRRDLVRLNDEFEGRIGSLVHGTLSLEDETVEFVSTARFLGALLLFDGVLDEEGLARRQRDACGEIRSRIATALEKSFRIALCTLSVGDLALVCAWTPGPDETASREAARAFLHRVHAVLDSATGPGGRLTQVQSRECGSFTELHGELMRAHDLAARRILLGIGRQVGLPEVENMGEQADALCRALDGMGQAFRARSRLDFLSCLERADRALGGGSGEAHDEMEAAVERYLSAAIGPGPGDAPGPGSGWRQRMRLLGEELRGDERGMGPGELADRVVAFVSANYTRDIGIGRIAFHLGVTPNYLSTLFHREKGITFVKYLTRLRLEKARELLSVPGARVQDVARAVGYANVRHFSRLFQKQFDTHPSETPRLEKNAPRS